MKKFPELDLSRLRVRPMSERSPHHFAKMTPLAHDDLMQIRIMNVAANIRTARDRGAAVILIYGAHLVKLGGGRYVAGMMDEGWLTHVATNGAGAIHDWELGYHQRTGEDVSVNVRAGCFGAWESVTEMWQRMRNGHAEGFGLGQSLGDQTPLVILGRACTLGVPCTVHPGIGYDIWACSPYFDGALLGELAARDFRVLCHSVNNVSGGMVLNVGTAVMGPQVFEKALGCVNNLRVARHTDNPVSGHHVFVVDVKPESPGWKSGREPSQKDPAYYDRQMKSYSRTGARLTYVQCDAVSFLEALARELSGDVGAPGARAAPSGSSGPGAERCS